MMSVSSNYRDGFFCVLIENGIERNKCCPVENRRNRRSEIETLFDRPVESVS
jgi:hypothetical protein